MKKGSRKIAYAIMALLVLILAFYYVNSLIDNSINKVLIISHDKVNSLNSKSDIDYILDSLSSAKVKQNISTDDFISIPFKLINNKGMSLAKEFFIDYSNGDIYYKDQDDNKTYKIREDFKEFYFTHEAFDIIYENSNPPTLKITAATEVITPATNIHWSYKKLNGIYYSFNNVIESKDVYKFNKDNIINLNYSEEPSRLEYKLYKDSLVVEEGVLEENLIKAPDIDGNYKLNIKALYDDKINSYKGTIESEIDFVMDLPPTFTIDNENIYQGNLITIDVKNLNSDEVPFISQTLFKSFAFNEIIEGNTSGYIPVSYKMKPDKYNISYGVNDKTMNAFTINILPREFSIQYLTVDKNVESNTRNDKAYEEFYKYYTSRRYKSSSNPDFEKSFILPTKGRLSTEYGETRYVNNSPTSYNHSGLDIATPAGTPIYASNSGEVKLSMNLILTGNTVLVDHGNGFFTTYYHMQDRFVEEGDTVKTNEKIGTVGSTGFSTGPHLHFIISFYDQNLEPGYFIYNEPITYENYKALFDSE